MTAVTEDVYTVGAYMGEDWESFGLLADVAFDGAGNAHIVDMRAHRIVVVAPDGSFVRMVGGQGEGPGELRSPSSLHVYEMAGMSSVACALSISSLPEGSTCVECRSRL